MRGATAALVLATLLFLAGTEQRRQTELERSVEIEEIAAGEAFMDEYKDTFRALAK